MKRVVLLVVPLMVAGMCVNRVALAAKAGGVRRQINLSGDAINGIVPKGKAEFRKRKKQTKFKVEVERVNLPDGTRLTVNVTGSAVGTLTLNLRTGELELNSNDGATVPAVQTGDRVTVTDAGGTVLLSGQF